MTDNKDKLNYPDQGNNNNTSANNGESGETPSAEKETSDGIKYNYKVDSNLPLKTSFDGNGTTGGGGGSWGDSTDVETSDAGLADEITGENNTNLQEIQDGMKPVVQEPKPIKTIDGVNRVDTVKQGFEQGIVEVDNSKKIATEYSQKLDSEDSEFTDEEKATNAETETIDIIKRETYMEKLSILEDNDIYLNRLESKTEDLINKLAGKGQAYMDAPAVKRLIALKEERIKDQREFNEISMQQMKNNQYGTLGYRYQVSSATTLVQKQADANEEKIQTIDMKYEGLIADAVAAAKSADNELLDSLMKDAHNTKKDLSTLLDKSVGYEITLNQEARNTQEFYLNQQKSQMSIDKAYAEQLGAVLAGNPNADLEASARSMGIELTDGLKAMSLENAKKRRLDTSRTQSLINSSNRANRPSGGTSGVSGGLPSGWTEKSKSSWIDNQADSLVKSSGETDKPMNYGQAEIQARKEWEHVYGAKEQVTSLNGATQKETFIGDVFTDSQGNVFDLSGLERSDIEAKRRDFNKKQDVSSDYVNVVSNTIEKIFPEILEGSFTFGSSDYTVEEFKSKVADGKHEARIAIGYYGLDKAGKADFNKEWDTFVASAKETLRPGSTTIGSQVLDELDRGYTEGASLDAGTPARILYGGVRAPIERAGELIQSAKDFVGVDKETHKEMIERRQRETGQ